MHNWREIATEYGPLVWRVAYRMLQDHEDAADCHQDVFVDAMRRATGVWFGGGRQWRFVDAYLGSQLHELMYGVLDRGGVIAGSSAGASIQGEYMARGTPIGNTEIMADGYERGLGFLPGVAIDLDSLVSVFA